jgi:hypothetical protein
MASTAKKAPVIDIKQRRAEQYKNTFGTPEGEEVLKHLRAQWMDTPLLNRDPLVMAAACALHDAYLKIENLVLVGQGKREFKKPRVITHKEDDRYDVNEIVVPEES